MSLTAKNFSLRCLISGVWDSWMLIIYMVLKAEPYKLYGMPKQKIVAKMYKGPLLSGEIIWTSQNIDIKESRN